jgi:hypothetical protein
LTIAHRGSWHWGFVEVGFGVLVVSHLAKGCNSAVLKSWAMAAAERAVKRLGLQC